MLAINSCSSFARCFSIVVIMLENHGLGVCQDHLSSRSNIVLIDKNLTFIACTCSERMILLLLKLLLLKSKIRLLTTEMVLIMVFCRKVVVGIICIVVKLLLIFARMRIDSIVGCDYLISS